MRSIPSGLCCSNDDSLPFKLLSYSSAASSSLPFSSVNITNDFVSEASLMSAVVFVGVFTSITVISFLLLGDALIDNDESAPIVDLLDFIDLAGDLAGDNFTDLIDDDGTFRLLLLLLLFMGATIVLDGDFFTGEILFVLPENERERK